MANNPNLPGQRLRDVESVICGDLWAYIHTAKPNKIVIEEVDYDGACLEYTLEEATALRDWLNTVLPAQS